MRRGVGADQPGRPRIGHHLDRAGEGLESLGAVEAGRARVVVAAGVEPDPRRAPRRRPGEGQRHQRAAQPLPGPAGDEAQAQPLGPDHRANREVLVDLAVEPDEAFVRSLTAGDPGSALAMWRSQDWADTDRRMAERLLRAATSVRLELWP